MSWAWVCGLEPHNSGTPELQSKRGSEEEEEEEEEEVEEKKNVPSERCMNGGAPGPQAGGGTRVHLLCVAMLRHAMLCCGALSAVRVLRPVQPNVSLSQPGSEPLLPAPFRSAPLHVTPLLHALPRSSALHDFRGPAAPQA